MFIYEAHLWWAFLVLFSAQQKLEAEVFELKNAERCLDSIRLRPLFWLDVLEIVQLKQVLVFLFDSSLKISKLHLRTAAALAETKWLQQN
ncbi:hypothetical protein C9J01_19745 [Photobacterium rosenbergii]|uniref:Uncharacterized protein n=1 Tax=Photobacterium rosenbergii TaxID=294936 RepID=A0A2T3N9J8_9GAMM|nr:hypothetical protein C9J01_19745 [Photobacterium rosenbergii]